MKDYKEQMKDGRWIAKSKEIKVRDNFTCQLCGKRNCKLNVHHIRYINGLDYWDYPDDMLMTVCETCHAKIHGHYHKEEISKDDKKNNKVIFYNAIFNDNDFKESNDKIIYSYLVYLAIIQKNDKNGDKRMTINDIVKSLGKKEEVSITKSELAKDLNMSVNTIRSRIKVLIQNGFVRFEDEAIIIYIKENIKDSFYFELLVSKPLKGESLIVYSYLKHKSKKFKGIIATYDTPQAKEFGISKKHYQKILCQLYSLGLAERLDNGLLKIN